MNTRGSRLAIVASHPIQYYAPWFRWMQAHGWTLRVFYLWDFGVVAQEDREFGKKVAWDIDLLSGYEHEFVPNQANEPGTHHFDGLDNPSLSRRVRAWKPDATLVFGYKYKTHLRLLINRPSPLIFRGDSHLLDAPAPGLIKRLALGLVYSRFSAVTYVGGANFDYFRAFGVSPQKLFHAPHCVDAGHFAPTDAWMEKARRLRAQLGLGDSKTILFAGKWIPKKQPLELLRAFLAMDVADIALVFVGDGELAPALRELAASQPDKLVRFLPFANQSEMPACYLLADIFALPSRGPGETWGLAVNEAMHLGVPCLVSDRVGCQRDLITEGQTGWVFNALSGEKGIRESLTRALGDLAIDSDGLKHRVLERIARFTYAQASEGLAAAVNHVTGRDPRA